MKRNFTGRNTTAIRFLPHEQQLFPSLFLFLVHPDRVQLAAVVALPVGAPTWNQAPA